MTLIVCDFNSHSKLWGCLDTNDKGEIVENFIAENGLCLFNDKQSTYLHSPTRTYFALDMSICSPNKSSTRSKINRPWFNNDVKNVINKRKSA